MEYGVQVDNKFVFGSDDELADPSDLLKLSIHEKKTPAQKKAEREAAKKAKAKEEAEKKAAAAIAAVNKENRPANTERGRGGPRGTRGGPRGRDGPRPPRTDRPDGDSPGQEGQGEFRGGRGRGRGAPRGDRPFRSARGGGPRGPVGDSANPDEIKEVHDENTPPAAEGFRRGRGAPGFRPGRGGPRGGRQFDRQSGSDKTGVRSHEKKEGHGKGNWGTTEDVIEAETDETKVEDPEVPPVPREKTAEELEREAREAEEAKFKTLAEYRASLRKDDAKFNTRKAGEGSDDNFGKLVPLTRKELQEEEGTHEVLIVQGKENKKKLVEVNIRFADQGRDHRSGERGGRGRGRGTRATGSQFAPRGAPRSGGQRHDSQFKADLRNDKEFPTLA